MNYNKEYDKEMQLINDWTDMILDLINESDDMTRSDLQGTVEAMVRGIMDDVRNTK